MQAEVRAVTLAWLAGLDCPVINRPDAALWYRASASLLTWRATLRGCGLPVPEAVVTNDPAEARAFRCRLARDGVAGAVYSPAYGASRLPPRRRRRLGAARRSAGAGAGMPDRAAWRHHARLHGRQCGYLGSCGSARGRGSRARAAALRRSGASRLCRGRRRPIRGGLAVVAVDSLPRLEHFASPARACILDALVTHSYGGRHGHDRCCAMRVMILVCGGLSRRCYRACLLTVAGLRLSLPPA